jgi:hypothetical protein
MVMGKDELQGITAFINLFIAIISLMKLWWKIKSLGAESERPPPGEAARKRSLLIKPWLRMRSLRRRSETSEPVATKWKRLFWISSSVFVISIAVILLGPRLFRFPEIEITNVAEGDSVVTDVMVKGTSRNIPGDNRIWLVIYSHPVKRFYPQERPADMQVGGDWSSRCYFGIREDVGERFDVMAILADKDAQQSFNEYLKNAEAERDWGGLEEIPEHTEAYQRITVTRK